MKKYALIVEDTRLALVETYTLKEIECYKKDLEIKGIKNLKIIEK